MRQRDVIDSEKIDLKAKMNELFNRSRYSLGSRPLVGLLHEQGYDIGRFKVRRLVKEMGLFSKQPGSHAYKQAKV